MTKGNGLLPFDCPTHSRESIVERFKEGITLRREGPVQVHLSVIIISLSALLFQVTGLFSDEETKELRKR